MKALVINERHWDSSIGNSQTVEISEPIVSVNSKKQNAGNLTYKINTIFQGDTAELSVNETYFNKYSSSTTFNESLKIGSRGILYKGLKIGR
jgi:hypothetical protein